MLLEQQHIAQTMEESNVRLMEFKLPCLRKKHKGFFGEI